MRLWAAVVLSAGMLGCAIAANAVDRTVLEIEGTRLFMAGEITTPSAPRFEVVLAQNPQLITVVLTQMSGSSDDAALIRMGYALREAGLNTHLTAQSEIYSGAVDLFLAGKRRSMAPGAVIGVHSWADGFGEGSSYGPAAPEHRANLRYTREMLGSAQFYWFTLQAAPSDGIHVMTRAEIARFGLLTE